MDALLETEKNKLSSTVPWLILLEVSIPSTPATTIYLVRNTENITFNSQEYTAQVSKGDISKYSCVLQNEDTSYFDCDFQLRSV